MIGQRPQSGSASRTTNVVAIAGVAAFAYFLRRILLPFAIAGIVALLCTPLIDRSAERTGWPRWLLAWAMLLLLMGCTAFLGWLLAPPLLRELATVGGDLEGTAQRLFQGLLGDRAFTVLNMPVDPARVASELVDRLRRWAGGDTIVTLGALGVAGLFDFILSWVLLAYFLVDGPRVASGLLWLVPPHRRSFALRVWKDLGPALRRYFAGVVLVVAYATLAAYIGLGWFLGLHHALLLALLTGILELIPVIGPLAAAVIAGLIALAEATGPAHVIAYIGYAIALRLSIDQVVGPLVLGRAGRVQPVLVIFCFLAGGALFGVTGVILGVPVALAVKAVLAARYEGCVST
jgi:predicted PurR-regulated permease PerM